MGIFQGRSKGSWFGFVANAGSGHGGPERHRKDNRGDGRCYWRGRLQESFIGFSEGLPIVRVFKRHLTGSL